MQQRTLHLRYLPSALLLCVFLNACDRQDHDTVSSNVEQARRSFAAFNAHDWVLHASHFSDSCRNLDPSYGDTYVIVDRKEKTAKYEAMNHMTPDIKDSITSIFGSGDKVVVQFISSGTAITDKGPYPWSLPICCVFTFKNGLVVVDETYYDRGK